MQPDHFTLTWLRWTLVVFAFAFLTASIFHIFPWLEGRLNGRIPGVLLGVLAFLAWSLATLVLAAIQIRRMLSGNRRRDLLVGWAALCIAISPWFALRIGSWSHESAFMKGFGAWTRSELRVAEVRHWHGAVAIASTPDVVPLWWPTEEQEIMIGIAVPASEWPLAITEMYPDHVRVLVGSPGTVMSWRASSPAGWNRFLLVGAPGTTPPGEFVNHMTKWHALEPGVHIGIATHR